MEIVLYLLCCCSEYIDQRPFTVADTVGDDLRRKPLIGFGHRMDHCTALPTGVWCIPTHSVWQWSGSYRITFLPSGAHTELLQSNMARFLITLKKAKSQGPPSLIVMGALLSPKPCAEGPPALATQRLKLCKASWVTSFS